MLPTDILGYIRATPFRPFRLVLNSGKTYDVRHPEFILITLREVVIGTQKHGEQFPGGLVYIDPIHITRIEPINGKRPHAKPRKVR